MMQSLIKRLRLEWQCSSRILLSCFLLCASLQASAQTDTAGVRLGTPPLQTLKSANDPTNSFRVLAYHDIRDNVRESFQTWPESTAIDTRDFIQQIAWLHQNGYQAVSMQQIVDARRGGKPLPDKAILLTFDDGFASVYHKVYPVLKQFHFPAVIALVGEWLQTPTSQPVQFGDLAIDRAQFLTWEQIREMQASGLIEVASHSYGLHKGIVTNPQGNLLPAAVGRRYQADLPLGQQYENDADYAARIAQDMRRNSDLIKKETGKAPRIMVWPYGAWNQTTAALARDAGMPYSLNLEPGPNTPQDDVTAIRRSLPMFNTGLSGLITMLRQPASHDGESQLLERVIHVDLDYIYDADPVQQEVNLSRLIDRIYRLHPTTVYLQAFADPDGDGVADALYFPNRHLPMRADLFSRTAWQLQTRTGVRVYAWMPVMSFALPATHPAATHVVQQMPGAPASASQGRYHRLSPFDKLARQTITEIYEDLGKNAIFTGVLFHDDATLSDYEDASPAAMTLYRDQWHLPASLDVIRNDPALRSQWTERKTAYVDDFTLHLAATLRKYRPALQTARNIYAEPVLNPASEDWFAQRFSRFLQIYDYTAVMAMPYMENASDPDAWLMRLVEKVKAQPGALRTTVFELQSRDWRNGEPIPTSTLAKQMRALHAAGARNLGYYPDDFHNDQPQETLIKPEISVETHTVRN
ncbi:poly-beta-1,6-N-acetyl-D-glucosamine N-deacetylase PgaB [uncultured Oxalicibacterium sp.]|uniref:poly-beta-1,6-N-acetyl-D-glucosamine N-deacetylase PgaB n=1 Tax=uncultured Oxalicibacterium sp. TaxID=1168540 RepID=UPI0025E5BECD|nr:poly-beta-1,6-N-acetyl-D-glucosamine N-deacetylase PgaB [uncultured Oxalicibacterium sp.]